MPIEYGSNEEFLASLSLDINPDIAAQIQAALIAPVEEAARRIEALSNQATAFGEEFASAWSTLADFTQEEINRIDELAEAFKNENLQAEIDRMVSLEEATQAEIQAAADLKTQWDSILETNDRMAKGYGVSGGMPGPAEAPDDSGSGGSLFGVAHAASVAGHATGSPALREVGAFLYIEEGLKRVMPLFEDLNKTIAETPSVLTPVIGGLTELGIPLAGLLTVALPLAVAVVAIGLAFSEFRRIIDEGNAAIKTAAEEQQKYYEFAVTATSEDAKKKLEHDQAVADSAGKTAGNIKGLITDELKRIGWDLNPEYLSEFLGNKDSAIRSSVMGDPQAQNGPLKGLIDSFDEMTKKAGSAGASVAALTEGLKNGDFAANDYKKTIADAVEASKAQAEEEAKIADLRESGTAKQVQAEMDRIKHQVEANQAQLDILSKLDQTNPDVIAAEEKIIDDNAELSKSYGELSGDVLELAKARDAEAAAIKEQLAQMKKVEKAEADYNQAREKAITDLAAQDEAAKQHEATAERQYTQGSLEDAEARRQIALKESREEVKLKEDTANRITDIGAKLGEKQYTDILNLSRQLYDDQIKYQDGIAKYEREAQDQAVDDQKEHLARLADLSKKDTADETEALLDRNFKKLYTDGLHRQESADKENESYREREDKLADHLRRQERELGISTQQEEAKQKLTLQRKLEDDQRAASAEVVQAVINANRKLQVLEQLEHQQLADLTAMENYKIRLLHQGLTDEMKLYAQQEQAKLALLAHTRDLILAQNPLGMLPQGASRTGSDLTAQPYHSGPSSRTATAIFDSGGSFGGGDMWSKGSLAEDVRFASGRGYNLGGSAIVYPLESGTVKPGGGKNIQFSPTLNINVPPGQQIDGKKLMNELWGEFQSLIGAP